MSSTGGSRRMQVGDGTELRFGFVIAGGKSSRMGADKAFLEFGGQTLLARALVTLGSVCNGVAIVGEASKFANLGVAVIEDIYSGSGPLGGIHAALTQSPAEVNLMLAVDMPFISAELLKFLFSDAESSDAAVTVPRVGGGFQPLCAVYRRSFAAAAENALKTGNYKIDALFPKLPLRVIEEEELVARGFEPRLFGNLNTPDDVRSMMP
jgi:molybdopterin-guanine dinucleotide biosynthesis protein A